MYRASPSPIAQTVNPIQHPFPCACLLPRMFYSGSMLSNTTSRVFFHYVYVLESLKDGNRYIGYTNHLKRRLEEHKNGHSFSTSFRLPCRLIYFEGCVNEEDAKRREHYLKTTQGRRFLGLRLTMYTRHKKAFGMGS